MTRKIRGLWAVLAVLALLAGACGDDSATTTRRRATVGTRPRDDDAVRRSADGPTITIGTQDFGESAILAQIYGQALEQRRLLGGVPGAGRLP